MGAQGEGLKRLFSGPVGSYLLATVLGGIAEILAVLVVGKSIGTILGFVHVYPPDGFAIALASLVGATALIAFFTWWTVRLQRRSGPLLAGTLLACAYLGMLILFGVGAIVELLISGVDDAASMASGGLTFGLWYSGRGFAVPGVPIGVLLGVLVARRLARKPA